MTGIPFFQQLIDEELKQVRFDSHPFELYAPVNYVLSLGGKHLRPVLLLAGCDLFGGDIKKAIKPAVGIELFHNFTLLHDDIMDNAPLRRGHATVNKKWNNNIAILSGDVMFALSYSFMLQTDTSVLPEILSLFNTTAVQVCEGQQSDMNFEMRNDVSIDEYIEMIALKTSVLLAAGLRIGAIIGGASTGDAEHLYDFGKNTGIAFQLQDDLLDVYGNQQKFGKQTGGDIVSNKKTFLLLKALQLAKGELSEELQALTGTIHPFSEDKVKKVTSIYNSLDIYSITTQEIKKYFQQALEHLDAIKTADVAKKAALTGFTKALMFREM